MSQILINSFRETFIMVIAAGSISIAIGVPLGIFIANISNSPFKYIQVLYSGLFGFISLIRSIPFLLLMILFIPVTNWLIAHNYSYMIATIAPLATAGTLYLTVKVNDLIFDLLQKWAPMCKMLGAEFKSKFKFILIPEATPHILQEAANTFAILVGFSTIAGALGAGGLGQLAIEKSLNEPEPLLVLLSVAILVAMQQLFKYTSKLVVQQT